jgi:peptidoglycan/LPS O-acetylase OafA/YrhL
MTEYNVNYNQRFKSIDFLRLIAVLLIIFRHYSLKDISDDFNNSSILIALQRGGWIGVDIFFVISGFLISRLIFLEYQSTNSFNPVRFFIRRGFKIYPSFWLFIFLAGVTQFFLGTFNIHNIIFELLFIQNYFPGVAYHTWSLGVEEHFYLLIMFFSIIMIKGRLFLSINKVLLYSCIAILFIVTTRIFQIVFIEDMQYSFYLILFSTHTRIDSFIFGTLLSYLLQKYTNKFLLLSTNVSLVLLILSAVLLSWPFFININIYPEALILGLTVNAIGSCLLLLSALNFERFFVGNKIFSLLSHLGSCSYNMYLWHMLAIFTIDLLFPYFSMHWIFRFALYFILTSCIGYVVTKYIEKPILKFRDCKFSSKTN